MLGADAQGLLGQLATEGVVGKAEVLQLGLQGGQALAKGAARQAAEQGAQAQPEKGTAIGRGAHGLPSTATELICQPWRVPPAVAGAWSLSRYL